MKKYLLIVFIIGGLYCFSAAQNVNDELKAVSEKTNAQKTANSKDILTTFFRASIDNLLGNDHKFSLNSSFYGIDSLLRKRGSTRSYERQRRLRRTSFDLGITGTDDNEIKKISGGFTFTIINKKDIVFARMNAADVTQLEKMAVIIWAVRSTVRNFILAKNYAPLLEKEKIDIARESFNRAGSTHDYSTIDVVIKEALNDANAQANILFQTTTLGGLDFVITNDEIRVVVEAILSGKDPFHELYISMAERYARKPLWTFSPSGGYDRENKQGEFSFATYFTMGLGTDFSKKPWEIELKSRLGIQRAVSVHTVNYEDRPLSASIGVNKVLIQSEEKESRMELKIFAQYDLQTGIITAGNRRSVFNFNSTLRINVFKSLWIPITLKYDPNNGNFLGLFSFTANIAGK